METLYMQPTPSHQVGPQLCYVPFYVMPSQTAGAPATPTTAGGYLISGQSNQSLASTSSYPQPQSPQALSVVQPSGQSPYTIPSMPASSSLPAAPSFPDYRLANFASLALPQLTPQTMHTRPLPQAQYLAPPLTQFQQLAGGAPTTTASPQVASPPPGSIMFQNGMFFFAVPGSRPTESGQPLATTSTESTIPSSTSTTSSSGTVGGKKEIKFKYHMSLTPQLAIAANPLPKVVEMKKKRKPRARITGRVCTHCGATKTTEWRMGPEGRGTLCNACGLRFRKKLLTDGQKDTSTKISMNMLLNTRKKASQNKGDTSSASSSPASSPIHTPPTGAESP